METKLEKQTRWIASAYNVVGLYSVPLLTLVTIISMCNVFTSGYFSQYPFIGGVWAFIFAATIDVNIVRLFLESHCEKVKGNSRASQMAFWVALGLAIVTGAALLIEGLQQSIGLQWNDGTVKGFIGVLIAARVVLVVVVMAREGCKLGVALVQHEQAQMPFTQALKPSEPPIHQETLKADEDQAEEAKEDEQMEPEPIEMKPPRLKVVNPSPSTSEKRAFIVAYLSEHPDASISTIMKAAKVKGLTLSQGYVSEQRKMLQEQAS